MGKRCKTNGSPTVKVIYSSAEIMFASLLRVSFFCGRAWAGGGRLRRWKYEYAAGAALQLSGERATRPTTAWQPTAQEVNQVQLEAFFWDKGEKRCCQLVIHPLED